MPAKQEAPVHADRPLGGAEIETIIEGSTDREIIEAAVASYLGRLTAFAFPEGLDKTLTLPDDVRERIGELKPIFERRIEQTAPMIVDIIQQVNKHAEVRRSDEFQQLVQFDISQWLPPEMTEASEFDVPQFAVIACVDKGIPYESVIGVEGNIGRMLGGRIEFAYIPTLNKFVMLDSALYKRLIHTGRQGYKLLIEPQIAHTDCGRQNQVVSNEYGDPSIPSISFVFNNLRVIAPDLPGDPEVVIEQLDQVRALWESYERNGPAVYTPDKGLYADVVVKMAQRQALVDNEFLQIYSPVEIFDKDVADLIVGVDNPDVLTDPVVLEEKGFTETALENLRSRGLIFSIQTHSEAVSDALEKIDTIPVKGARTYEELQKNWLTVETELVNITAALWQLSQTDSEDGAIVRTMAEDYLDKALSHLRDKNVPEDTMNLVRLRLTHHLFHAVAYTYLLDTFTRHNVPGHHIEKYLSVGDHDSGTREIVGLGQGDLERPTATEMYTGYTVLHHSDPGHHDGYPVVTMIKVDTDRSGNAQISTEESGIGRDDLREYLKLWPYLLCGDLQGILLIRGKKHGGISRLGLSVLLSFKTMLVKLERSDSHLPHFVPASTKKGKVVLVPAEDVLMAGIEAGDNLQDFRHEMQNVARRYDRRAVQKSFRQALSDQLSAQ